MDKVGIYYGKWIAIVTAPYVEVEVAREGVVEAR